LTEALDGKGNLFGQDRLEVWLAKHAGETRSAAQIRDKFLHELQCFQGQITTNDDMTLIVLARNSA
jgi:serine phosphatase RsbU (regulator of sigma subunit)